jgi:ABC transporter substrate binding protein
MADDLIHHQVAVIAAFGTPATMAAKAATTTIPIVFGMAGDPVKLGFVASLNRLGGNVTGATILTLAVTPKRLELLHELIPTAHVMALLVNPANPTLAEDNSSSVRSAADALGLELHVLNASTEQDFDEVFAKLTQLPTHGRGNLALGLQETPRLKSEKGISAYHQPSCAVERLHREINACVADPKFSARVLELGFIPFVSTQAEFAAFVVESTEKWAKVIQAAGIKAE